MVMRNMNRCMNKLDEKMHVEKDAMCLKTIKKLLEKVVNIIKEIVLNFCRNCKFEIEYCFNCSLIAVFDLF